MKKDILTLKDYSGGWGKDLIYPSNSVAIEAALNQYSKSNGISFLRYGKEGHISPGETFTTVTDAGGLVNNMPVNAAVVSNGYVFFVLANSRAVWIDLSETVVGSDDTNDTHSSLIGEDILSYKNSTNEYILVSYRDATDWNIKRMLKDGTSPDGDWLSTSTLVGNSEQSALTANKSNPHKLKIGPDGFIYATNGQFIAQHDPESTTWTLNKLDLGDGWIATDLDVDGNYLIASAYKATTYITGYYYSQARVYYWDCASATYLYVYELNDNYVSAIKNKNGVNYAFTFGRNNTMKVKAFLGGQFETIFESCQIGSVPTPGSIDIFEDKLHFLTSSGIMYLDGKAFHFRTNPTTDGESTATCQMLKNLAANVLYIGMKVGASYYIGLINRSGYLKNVDFRTRMLRTKFRGTITRVRVYFSQFGSGASLILSLFKNYTALSVGGSNDLLYKTLSYTNLGGVKFVDIPCFIADVNQFYLNYRFNHSAYDSVAAIVENTEIIYQDSNFGY